MSATLFNMRSSTHNDPYASFEITAAVVYTAGQMILYNDTVGVIVSAVAIGAQAVLVYHAAKIVVPCVAITSGNIANFALGSMVYFDVADAEVNATAGGNTLCGRVTEAPVVGDETIEIHLSGNCAA